jgi:hypothetical protein
VEPDQHIALGLTDEEQRFIVRALDEWGGPTRCTEEFAVAMGFLDVADFQAGRRRIAEELTTHGGLVPFDWGRALLAAEVVFASDVVGSGVDWSSTTTWTDEESIRLLRSIQRKVAGNLRGELEQIGTLPPRKT